MAKPFDVSNFAYAIWILFMKIVTFLSLVFLLTSAVAGHHEHDNTALTQVAGDLTVEQKIRVAKAAAPSNVSDNALILDVDNTVLQQGDNGWTCMVGSPPSYGNPMCIDPIWAEYFAAYFAEKPYKARTDAIGISYMLVGDLPMDNDDPFNLDTSKNTWVQEGPHLMLLVPQSLFGTLPTDPYTGGPYVMWQGSQYAHIMVPLEKTDPISYDE